MAPRGRVGAQRRVDGCPPPTALNRPTSAPPKRLTAMRDVVGVAGRGRVLGASSASFRPRPPAMSGAARQRAENFTSGPHPLRPSSHPPSADDPGPPLPSTQAGLFARVLQAGRDGSGRSDGDGSVGHVGTRAAWSKGMGSGMGHRAGGPRTPGRVRPARPGPRKNRDAGAEGGQGDPPRPRPRRRPIPPSRGVKGGAGPYPDIRPLIISRIGEIETAGGRCATRICPRAGARACRFRP